MTYREWQTIVVQGVPHTFIFAWDHDVTPERWEVEHERWLFRVERIVKRLMTG